MIPSDFIGPLFGLAAALSWGTGDFNGGLATRKVNIYIVLLLAEAVGMIVIVALLLINREAYPGSETMAWAFVAGAIGVCGLGLFYLAMARGQIAIAAPVTGVLAVLVPVIFTAIFEGLPPAQQIVGFALAILGIYLLSRPAEGSVGHGGLGLAILSGLFFGLYYILIDKSGEHATYWPLMMARIGAAAVVGGFLIATKPSWDGVSGVMGTASISGVLDAFGGFFFLSASQYGRLDVAAVLSSLYPVVTTLLAIFFLKEKLTVTHWSGLLAAGVAIALVTFPPIF